jgi:diacylglycerol kinase (ATP)
MRQMGREYLVIANARARGVLDKGRLEAAVDVLRRSGSVELVLTEDVAQLGSLVAKREDRIVVSAGGDGSLHSLLQSLDEQNALPRATIGLLPLGTGNDTARALSLPMNPTDAASAIVSGRRAARDLIVSDSGFSAVNVIHTGIGALASARAGQLKRVLGRYGYPVGAALVGARSRTWNLTVTVDDSIVLAEGPCLLAAICNGSYIGGGHALAAGADLDDGFLNVVVVRSTTFRDQVALGVNLMRRESSPSREHLIAMKAESVRIESEGSPYVADGDALPPATLGSWRVRRGGWAVLLPR